MSTTIKIPVKYIDTRKYIVTASEDSWDYDSPADWGNFSIVTFFKNKFTTDTDISEYYTDNGKLKPSYQAKVKAGKMFPIDLYEHSQYIFTLAGEGANCRWDTSGNCGFIIFDDDYIKGTTYEQRKAYARSDLEVYTQWANGYVHHVVIKTDTGLEITNMGGVYDVDSFVKGELGDVDYEVEYV